MKRFTFILGLLLIFAVSCQNNKKQDEKDDETNDMEMTDSLMKAAMDTTANRPLISATIHQFIQAYNAQDNQQINGLIHPEIGITFIHRPGAIDWFEKVDRIDFSEPIPSYYPYVTAEHSYTLLYEASPIFSCETESWNKQGLFVDVIEQTNRLGPIAEHLKEYNDVELDVDYQESIEKAEQNSHRVILTTDTPLVFHVKEIEGKWYVTILDRSYGDCSA